MKNTAWKYYHEAPNDLNYAVSDVYELSVLTYLIQLGSDCAVVHPSQKTLMEKCMTSKDKLNKTLNLLVTKGYITRKRTPIEKATEYIINYDAIQVAIIRNTPVKDIDGKAKREITEKGYDSMAKRRVLKSPVLTSEVINIAMGDSYVVDKITGEVLNGKTEVG